MQTTEQTKKIKVPALGAAVALGLIMLALVQALLFAPASEVAAAPPLAPTPVASIPGDSDNSLYVVFQTGSVSITADTNTSGKLLQGYEYVDLQITTDQTTVGATGANTTTITVQFSNDGSNWDDGPAILSSNATDTTDISRIMLFGRYARFKQDVTNTNPVTITLLGLAK